LHERIGVFRRTVAAQITSNTKFGVEELSCCAEKSMQWDEQVVRHGERTRRGADQPAPADRHRGDPDRRDEVGPDQLHPKKLRSFDEPAFR
jgi:hypothetical protein